MSIQYIDTFFHDKEKSLHFVKNFPEDKYFYCHIVLESETFIEYQKNLFEDFLGVLVDAMNDEHIGFNALKKVFENELQDLNTKLYVFAEKIKDAEPFSIKGVIQILFGFEYLSSLIGDTGVIVLRDGEINYMMSNAAEKDVKIQTFSEIIEGEVREYDEIITLGTVVDTYIDKKDIATIQDLSKQDDVTFVDALVNVLSVRVSKESIAFISKAVVESSALFTQKKVKKTMSEQLKQFGKWSEKLLPYQHYIIYGFISLLGLFLVYWLVQGFTQSNQARFIETKDGEVIEFTIEDIQKDIALFKRMDASSGEKVKKYNHILSNLDLLKKHNKRTDAVAKLRKILEKEYYEGFNIILANNESYFSDPVLKFRQQEKNIFGEVQNIFYKNALFVGGKEGVLVGAVNDKMRGTLVSASIDMKFNGCTLNFAKTGLFCYTEDGKIYNIVKGGQVNPVTNSSGVFPINIVQLATYLTTKLYILTDDESLNSKGTHIVKYQKAVGDSFKEGVEYLLPNMASGSSDFSTEGFSSVAIDGSFMTWSRKDKKVYQLRRPNNLNNNFESREVALHGGDTIEPYSVDTKVFSFKDSRFVYLFDKEHQTFTVYRSTPYKTNTKEIYKYSLQYFFRVKFSVSDKVIKDVYIDEGERAMLYLLTDDGVYGLKLYDFRKDFFDKENNKDDDGH